MFHQASAISKKKKKCSMKKQKYFALDVNLTIYHKYWNWF